MRYLKCNVPIVLANANWNKFLDSQRTGKNKETQRLKSLEMLSVLAEPKCYGVYLK